MTREAKVIEPMGGAQLLSEAGWSRVFEHRSKIVEWSRMEAELLSGLMLGSYLMTASSLSCVAESSVQSQFSAV